MSRRDDEAAAALEAELSPARHAAPVTLTGGEVSGLGECFDAIESALGLINPKGLTRGQRRMLDGALQSVAAGRRMLARGTAPEGATRGGCGSAPEGATHQQIAAGRATPR